MVHDDGCAAAAAVGGPVAVAVADDNPLLGIWVGVSSCYLLFLGRDDAKPTHERVVRTFGPHPASLAVCIRF
jgi:hypothetical protein